MLALYSALRGIRRQLTGAGVGSLNCLFIGRGGQARHSCAYADDTRSGQGLNSIPDGHRQCGSAVEALLVPQLTKLERAKKEELPRTLGFRLLAAELKFRLDQAIREVLFRDPEGQKAL